MTRDIVERQREFFRSGKTLPVEYRIRTLKALREAIVRMEPEIETALREDLGKSPVESYMCESGMVLSELSYTLKNIRKWSRTRRVRTPLAQFPAKSYIIPEPYGNVLIMSPWNYPFLLCISPLVSAIAAGNTAIIKPSAYSPATSRIISALVSRVFDPGHVSVVEGGRDVNSDLLEQKFDYIFFTGSKAVGRLVMTKAAAHLTPVTLELGGKSPVIVDRTADLRVSARRIVFGKFLNCGQTCVAPDYVLVDNKVADRFMEMCKEETLLMYGFDALANENYGHIINRKHFDRLSALASGCMAAGKHPYYRIGVSRQAFQHIPFRQRRAYPYGRTGTVGRHSSLQPRQRYSQALREHTGARHCAVCPCICRLCGISAGEEPYYNE